MGVCLNLTSSVHACLVVLALKHVLGHLQVWASHYQLHVCSQWYSVLVTLLVFSPLCYGVLLLDAHSKEFNPESEHPVVRYFAHVVVGSFDNLLSSDHGQVSWKPGVTSLSFWSLWF